MPECGLRPSAVDAVGRQAGQALVRIDVSTFSLQPIGHTQLPHDLLRPVSLPLQLSHLLARSGDRDSHNGWTNFRGSSHLVVDAFHCADERGLAKRLHQECDCEYPDHRHDDQVHNEEPADRAGSFPPHSALSPASGLRITRVL